MFGVVMSSDESREDQIVAAYAAGEPVDSIAARFHTHPAEIERVVAQDVYQPPTRPRARFNPPPGWPPAPEGWFPPAGWRPDASWPAPPPGWQLFVEEPDDRRLHHYPGVSPTPGPTPAGGPDPIDQLRRLGELRDAGIVTDEEFAAKKAEILARL